MRSNQASLPADGRLSVLGSRTLEGKLDQAIQEIRKRHSDRGGGLGKQAGPSHTRNGVGLQDHDFLA